MLLEVVVAESVEGSCGADESQPSIGKISMAVTGRVHKNLGIIPPEAIDLLESLAGIGIDIFVIFDRSIVFILEYTKVVGTLEQCKSSPDQDDCLCPNAGSIIDVCDMNLR